jgi:hypothetical protein
MKSQLSERKASMVELITRHLKGRRKDVERTKSVGKDRNTPIETYFVAQSFGAAAEQPCSSICTATLVSYPPCAGATI